MFLALYAYEDAHRKLCSATMSDPKPAGDLSGNFGVFVKYFGGYHGGVFEANYDSNTRGYFYPSPHSFRLAESNENEIVREDEVAQDVETVLKISYTVGGEERVLYFNSAFSRKAFEGKECCCCRFHDKDGSKLLCTETHERNMRCPVHSLSRESHPFPCGKENCDRF